MTRYKHWEQKMFDLNIEKLKDSKIYIFGAGQRGMELYYFFRINGYSVSGFVDNDIKKKGRSRSAADGIGVGCVRLVRP